MKHFVFGVCAAVSLTLGAAVAVGAAPPSSPESKQDGSPEKPDGGRFEPFKPESVTSNGSVTIDGRTVSYQAIAGTLVVHPKDWDDVPRNPNPDKSNPGGGDEGESKNPTAVASMFYVAYF